MLRQVVMGTGMQVVSLASRHASLSICLSSFDLIARPLPVHANNGLMMIPATVQISSIFRQTGPTVPDKWACQAHIYNERRRRVIPTPNCMSFFRCGSGREMGRLESTMYQVKRGREEDCLDGGGANDNELSVCLCVCVAVGHLRGRSLMVWQKPIDHCLVCALVCAGVYVA